QVLFRLFGLDALRRLHLLVGEVVVGLSDQLLFLVGDAHHLLALLALGVERVGRQLLALGVLLIGAALGADRLRLAEVVELGAAAVTLVLGSQIGHRTSSPGWTSSGRGR